MSTSPEKCIRSGKKKTITFPNRAVFPVFLAAGLRLWKQPDLYPVWVAGSGGATKRCLTFSAGPRRKCEETITEIDYEKWHSKQEIPTPSVEVIQMRFKSWNAAKKILKLKIFPPGHYANLRWNNSEWLPVLVRFIEEQLSYPAYKAWAAKNNAPAKLSGNMPAHGPVPWKWC